MGEARRPKPGFVDAWNAAESVHGVAAALGRTYGGVRQTANRARKFGCQLKRFRPGARPRPILDRIRPRLNRQADGCVVWRGMVDGTGRPRIAVKKKGIGAEKSVARHVWQAERGPIPAGMRLIHCKRNKRCVAPAHGFLAVGSRGHAKLTPAQDAEIVRRYRDGESARALAAEFGIHPTNVCRKARTFPKS